MVFYIISAAAVVSVPGIVANQMGLRIGDLSMFAQEDTEPPPPEAAPQLVSYEKSKNGDEAEEINEVNEEDLPRKVMRGASFVAFSDDKILMIREKLLAARGDAPAEPRKNGGH